MSRNWIYTTDNRILPRDDVVVKISQNIKLKNGTNDTVTKNKSEHQR
jgi:hypothetical protein